MNTRLRTTGARSIRVDLDTDKAAKHLASRSPMLSALQTFLGGLLCERLQTAFGRTWRCCMQAEPQFRVRPDDINNSTRAATADMIPLSTLVNVRATSGRRSSIHTTGPGRRQHTGHERRGIQLRAGRRGDSSQGSRARRCRQGSASSGRAHCSSSSAAKARSRSFSASRRSSSSCSGGLV